MLLLANFGTPTIEAQAQSRSALSLPKTLSDSAFWRLSTTLSEPAGYFNSENFTSNEPGFADAVRHLRERALAGGAYLGVGPEQSYHYIAAIRPPIAFLIDIRKNAGVHHLMYKAIFELAADRVDFISILFSKPRPAGLDSSSSIARIWAAFRNVASDSVLFERNSVTIANHLQKKHGFPLSGSDMEVLSYIYSAFYWLGPDISYDGYKAVNPRSTFFTLTSGIDRNGIPRSFLATEADFRVVKEMHRNNLIIPVIANLEGTKGLNAIATYLMQHNAQVDLVYISNVEQYLGSLSALHANLSALPYHSSSVIIRSQASVCLLHDYVRMPALCR